MKIGDWVFSSSDDWFTSCGFSTKEACIEEAKEAEETSIYVGEVSEKYSIGGHVVDYLIEAIEEDVFNFNGNDELSEGTEETRAILLEDVTKALAKFCGIAEETVFRLTKVKPIIIVNQSVKGFFKCKKKKNLYEFVVMLLSEINDLNSFAKHNDITDSIAQAYYYINKNIKQIRYDKDYGFIYII
jgi:hypothetical protein